MLIFEHDTYDKDCIFNPTNDTKNYVVCFFGFFPHSLRNRLCSFLESIDIIDVAGANDVCSSLFKLEDKYAIEAYEACSRKKFDVSIVLPYTFTGIEEAQEWFNQKVSNSRYISHNDLAEFAVIDGDTFIEYLRKTESENKKEEFIDQVIKDNLNQMVFDLERELLKEYNQDSHYAELIQLKIQDYRELLDLDNK